MTYQLLARKPADANQQIPASQWLPPSILDAFSPCILQSLSTSMQYVTRPSAGSISMRFQGHSVVLNGFTWSDRGSMPNIFIDVSQSTGVASVNQTAANSDSGNGSLFKTCSPLTATVTGLDPASACTLTLDMSSGDPGANELVILTGFVAGPNPQIDAPLPPSHGASTQPPGPAPSNTRHPGQGSTSDLPTARSTATESALPTSTGTNAPRRSHVALEAMILIAALCLLAILMVVAYVRRRKLKRRRDGMTPYWDRSARVPKETGRNLKVRDPRDHSSEAERTDEVVALNDALRHAGLTVPELMELCSMRRSPDPHRFGALSETSSMPPEYTSHASLRTEGPVPAQ
ncbi:hypothetical protein AURDEDRAFT_128359 [Auricularia subglabra TFB-10046 SS5]|nr:hypothetical protein AURDEDRAFT_128359 [Auricularia subglabra TFB-10046 SS5]